MDSPTALQEFLEYVIAQLIEHHDQASVVHELDRGRHVFRAILHEDDVGKIIGKNGYTISSIRSLLDAASMRTRTKATFRVEYRKRYEDEPDGGTDEEKARESAKADGQTVKKDADDSGS